MLCMYIYNIYILSFNIILRIYVVNSDFFNTFLKLAKMNMLFNNIFLLKVDSAKVNFQVRNFIVIKHIF